MTLIFKGIIIGMIVVFPIGPLGIITTQRAINGGWKRGFFSGLGAAVSDMFYSSGAIFGLSHFSDFLNTHRLFINNIIGIVFFVIGMGTLMNAIKNKHAEEYKENQRLHPALSHFLLGLVNPFTLLIFLFVFTKMDMAFNADEILLNLVLIFSIFAGALIFWFITTNLVSKLRNHIKIKRLYQFNQVVGCIIASFGIFYIARGFLGF